MRPSATLATNERIRELVAAGSPVVHLAFGEAGLPVHPVLREMLDAAASKNSYPPVAGTAAARSAAAGWFSRRGVACTDDAVILAPGSKPLLFAVLMAIDAVVILPRPSWVSYAAQAQLANRHVVRLPVPGAVGGVPDPDALRSWAREHPRQQAVLLLTLPDNPTGTVAGKEVLGEVCEVAREQGWWILSDEIYRDLAYEPDAFTSPAQLLSERTVVTSGLSKHLALGGWRAGFARFPGTNEGRRLREVVEAIASEVWSAMAAPMQEVAAFALEEPDEIRDFVDAGRRLHREVNRALHRVLSEHEVDARPPAGGFYLYPDFGRHAAALGARGIDSSDRLAARLLDEHRVAVLPGSAFGDDPERLAVRVASSLLYGAGDDERWTALNSSAPAELPWIAGALQKVGDALESLTSP